MKISPLLWSLAEGRYGRYWPTVILIAVTAFILLIIYGCAPQEPHIGPSLTVEEFACVWETEQTEGCVE